MGVVRRLRGRVLWPDAVAHAGSRVVVCHEWFTTVGGSDKVAAELAHVTSADVVYTFALDRRCVEAVHVPSVWMSVYGLRPSGWTHQMRLFE